MTKKIRIFVALFAIAIMVILLSACSSQEEFKVNFVIDDEFIYHSVTTSGNEAIVLPEAPEKEGYVFTGWVVDGKAFEVNSLVEAPISENITAYATWELINYTASFYADGALVGSTTFTVEDDVLTNIPETPEKEGFFSSWEDYELGTQDLSVNAAYYESVSVKIRANMSKAVNIDKPVDQVIYATDPVFKDAIITENIGYKFSYYEINGEKVYSDVISIDDINKDVEIDIYAEYATYELPIINIDTGGAAIQNKYDYVDMTFSLENCDGELQEVTGGIRLRGNSTMSYPKKPYRIKFDNKQSLFGLEKAKSWVLLAEYLDPSALHNYTAFSLAQEMPGMGFNPTPNKVNVYLNGEFMGLYTLCEQVQENEGRVGIELNQITADMTDLKDFNFLICMDRSVTGDLDAVPGETYFALPIPEYEGNEFEEEYMVVELKYPEKSQFASEEQFTSFFTQLRDYMTYILNILATEDAESIKEELNVNSLIDYLIVDQIMDEDDHHFKSFYMYYTNTSDKEEENGKLSFGPVWDYDYSLGVPWQGVPNQHFEMSNRMYFSNIFFRSMANIPEFYELAKERYELYMAPAVEKFLEGYDALVASMDESVALNQELWYGDPSRIGGSMTPGYYNNFVEIGDQLSVKNVEFLKKFLEYRIILLNRVWLEQ